MSLPLTITRLAALAAVLTLGGGLAHAQTAPEPGQKAEAGPWRLAQALNLPEGVRVTGQVRPRYEALHNTFVAGRTDDDEFLGLQTTLGVEIDAGKSGFTFGGELVDSRFVTGNKSGGAAAEIDALEPTQLYVSWRPHDVFIKGAKLDVTAGRFTMDIGSRRLVARSNYRSILASFDGVKAVWKSPDNLSVMLAYTALVTREPTDAASAFDNEVALNDTQDGARFSVAQVDAPLPHGLRGDAYVFDLDEKDSADLPTRNRQLTTFGLRLRKPAEVGQFDFETEFNHQTGSQHATTSPADTVKLNHNAQMVHLEAGYSFSAPWSPRLALQYDYGSGDASPADNKSGRFDALFGDRTFDLGPTSIFGLVSRSNVSSPAIRLEVKPDPMSDAYLALRHIRLDKAGDSFANSGVRDVTGASGKDVGTLVDARYRHWLVKDSLRLSVGASILLQGDFLKTAPNRTGFGNPVYGFTDLTWTF